MDRRIIIFLILILVLIAGYFFWDMALFGSNDEDIKNDIIGGQTPEETVKLFVIALKADDPQSASNFFALDEEIERERWKVAFESLKERGSLTAMGRDIERAVKNPEIDASSGQAEFILKDTAGEIIANIILIKNQYTGVWKIKSI